MRAGGNTNHLKPSLTVHTIHYFQRKKPYFLHFFARVRHARALTCLMIRIQTATMGHEIAKQDGDMIVLYQYPPHFGVPNMSPFCMKLECFLRMQDLEYEVVAVQRAKRAPKGKCPYIIDDGVEMGDSELIMDYLVEKYGRDPERDLSEEQRAVARALQAMLDERLYWVLVYSRWQDPAIWPDIRASLFGGLPAIVRDLVPVLAQRGVRGQLWQQGMGRHREAEIYAFGRADLQALANYLGDKDYLHGAAPSRIDACAMAHTANILIPGLASPLLEEIQRHRNLCDYTWRMMARFFADYLPEKEAMS